MQLYAKYEKSKGEKINLNTTSATLCMRNPRVRSILLHSGLIPAWVLTRISGVIMPLCNRMFCSILGWYAKLCNQVPSLSLFRWKTLSLLKIYIGWVMSVLMFQTSDNSQLLRRVLWINAELTSVWHVKKHPT